MRFRLTQRSGFADRHAYAVEQFSSLESARRKAMAGVLDYVIEDRFGNPVEYRIA